MNDQIFSSKRIAEITAKVGSGITPKGGASIYRNFGPKLIRSQNVYPGRLVLEDVACIPEDIHESMKATRVQGGDVLLNITGASIGRCATAPFNLGEANVNQHVCIIRTKEGEIDPLYLMYYLNSFWGQDQINRFQAGGNREGLNFAQIRSMEIPCPPLPEQKKIAEILSGIDRQKEVIAKKIANTIQLQTALGGNIFSSLDGEGIPLGEICNPKQWKTISATQLTNSGYPVYGANGMIGYFSEYNHRDPVLAVTCRGATCGNLTLVPGFSYVTGNSMCLDNPRSDTSPEYLFRFLSWRGLKDVISGSAQPQITRTPLQAVEVILPSKDKQKKIVSALESVSNTERSLNAELDRLDLLKQAVSSDLLSGRKRVRI